MIRGDLWLDVDTRAGVLIDTNLLVLFAVGTVNRNRISAFKRTNKYTPQDYDLLVLQAFGKWFTVAHVLAEVSNLTDLSGMERLQVREFLKQTISLLHEDPMPSSRAAEDSVYNILGLTDAAIAAVARKHNCIVLTDDLDLYLAVTAEISALNFSRCQRKIEHNPLASGAPRR